MLHRDHLLELSDVLQRVQISRATLYRMLKREEFPGPQPPSRRGNNTGLLKFNSVLEKIWNS
jgi:predicted DNA-binding transcriptional regulator AlpA